jgi:ATP-dependent DNA ligase
MTKFEIVSEKEQQKGVMSGFLALYISRMLWRSSRGRPLNAPAVFIHPCQPIVAKQPPTGSGWAHELKHDGYRLQIHVRGGRVRLFTTNGADQLEWHSHPIIQDNDGQCAD